MARAFQFFQSIKAKLFAAPGAEPAEVVALPSSWFDEPAPRAEPAGVDAAAYAKRLGLGGTVWQARHRLPRQEQPDLLPDLATFDTTAARNALTPPPEGEVIKNRSSMLNQVGILRSSFEGRPEILFWHALAISYLRRRTPHTAKAQAIFFRIWDEQPRWMAQHLNGRWLISALQTFADHGRSHKELRCGSVGFIYGNLIKIYESEIASAYARRNDVDMFLGGGVPGLHDFQPGQEILMNINAFVFASTEGAGPAGMALARLMSIVESGDSIFSRSDEIARQKGSRYMSFKGRIKAEN